MRLKIILHSGSFLTFQPIIYIDPYKVERVAFGMRGSQSLHKDTKNF